MQPTASEVAPGVFRVLDTCHVYVIRAEPVTDTPNARSTGIAIDVGSGAVLDHLDAMGFGQHAEALIDVVQH